MSLDKAIEHGKENLIPVLKQLIVLAEIMEAATGVKRIDCIKD